jgi:hypothetical protein
LISTREDKHSGDTILTAVNRSHALLSDYRPYKTAASGTSSTGDGSSPATGQGSSTALTGISAASSIAPLVVEEVFKPSKDVKGEPDISGHVAVLAMELVTIMGWRAFGAERVHAPSREACKTK